MTGTGRRLRYVVLTLLLALVLCGCGGDRQHTGETEPAASASAEIVEEEPLYIQYPGFVDQYFDAEDRVILLENSKENTVSFQFELTDRKGTVLFSSEGVAPGESTGWDVTEHWKQNDHQLTITSIPILEDGTRGNPVSQTITVTVELGE